jgi:hypothetical protein
MIKLYQTNFEPTSIVFCWARGISSYMFIPCEEWMHLSSWYLENQTHPFPTCSDTPIDFCSYLHVGWQELSYDPYDFLLAHVSPYCTLVPQCLWEASPNIHGLWKIINGMWKGTTHYMGSYFLWIPMSSVENPRWLMICLALIPSNIYIHRGFSSSTDGIPINQYDRITLPNWLLIEHCNYSIWNVWTYSTGTDTTKNVDLMISLGISWRYHGGFSWGYTLWQDEWLFWALLNWCIDTSPSWVLFDCQARVGTTRWGGGWRPAVASLRWWVKKSSYIMLYHWIDSRE